MYVVVVAVEFIDALAVGVALVPLAVALVLSVVVVVLRCSFNCSCS